MVSFTRTLLAAAALVTSSSLVSAYPNLPIRDLSPVLDTAQRAAIDKNIGCITGVCGFNATARNASNLSAQYSSGASSSIPGWFTPAMAVVAVGSCIFASLL